MSSGPATAATERAPLGPPELESAERFWRAATYLAAAQLYLRDNFLLERPLRSADLKREPLGHWGTSPGIAFAYTHLSDFARRSGRRMKLVIGPGHAAPALHACTYLDGSLAETDPRFAHGRDGISRLIASFARPNGLDTEISAAAPGVIHAGGELGPALAIAQGAALDNPGLTVACLLGDGELETGPAASAWLGGRQLREVEMGAVLPILNLNRLRMGGPSVLGKMSWRELQAYFRGVGYEPLSAGPSHRELAEAFTQAERSLRSGDGPSPAIVVDTSKGWSGPAEFDGRGICGTSASHKAPFKRPAEDARQRDALEAWLRSYAPAELFDLDGVPHPSVLRCLPPPPSRLGTCTDAAAPIGGLPTAATVVPRGPASPAAAIASSLAARAKADNRPRRLRVFCPDELASNRMAELAEDGVAIEVLSEHLCHGWLNGYIQSGRHGLLASYEGFASVFASMTTQYLKFLAEARATPWRESRASFNLFLTSLAWNNCYTHQNPGFLDVLLTGEHPFVRVYTPVDAAVAVAAVERSLESRDRVNAIVAGKLPLPVQRDERGTEADLDAGTAEWASAGTAGDGEVDAVLAVAGDCLCNEALLAIELLRSELPRLRVRFVAVNELTSLGVPGEYEAALDGDRFDRLFPLGVPVVFPFLGHPGTLFRLLFRRPEPGRFTVLGFRSESGRHTPFETLVRCGTDRFGLAARIAATSGKAKLQVERLTAKVERAHASHRRFVVEHGTDPPWVDPARTPQEALDPLWR